MTRTPSRTRTRTTRSSQHAARRPLMHSGLTSHLWLKVSPCVSFHVIHACAPVCCSLSVSPHPSFYFLVLFLFQLYLMSNSAPDEFSIEDPLCNSSLGSMVTLDYVTPLTGYEPKEMELTDADELNFATTSDIYFQDTLDDNASFPNDPDVDDNQLAEFLAVVIDRTGKPVEVRSNNDQFSCDFRNMKSAQSQFPLVTQPKKNDQSNWGSVQERIAEERESSNAQIRTMLDEQRQEMIPTNSFYLVQVVVFRLPATFNSQAIDGGVNRTPSHIACTDADTLSAHHTRCYTTTRGSRVMNCVPKTFSHSISCSAPCLTTCTVQLAFCPLFHLAQLLLRSPAQAQG